MDGLTTVIVSVILSALAALVTCVLLARFDVNGRMAAAKNGGQQSKAVGQKRERYILYIPLESIKDAMLIVSRLKAKRYQILDVKGNVVKKGG